MWTKWSGLLAPYGFEEIRATLDALVRTHSRLPPLAELVTALGAARIVAATQGAESATRMPCTSGRRQFPPVDLEAGYVIGPYSAAFAKMNGEGWTVERLVEFTRAVDD